MENGKIINLVSIVKDYPMGRTTLTALNNVSLTFGSGEFAGLVGPSGSGKTTLLNIIGSLDTPTSGQRRGPGRGGRDAEPQSAAAPPQPPHRIHLPDLQPPAGLHGV